MGQLDEKINYDKLDAKYSITMLTTASATTSSRR